MYPTAGEDRGGGGSLERGRELRASAEQEGETNLNRNALAEKKKSTPADYDQHLPGLWHVAEDGRHRRPPPSRCRAAGGRRSRADGHTCRVGRPSRTFQTLPVLPFDHVALGTRRVRDSAKAQRAAAIEERKTKAGRD